MKSFTCKSQRGVFTVITAVGAVLLLLILGFAIDISRLMVIQSELKNSADACALAAVSELNGRPDAVARAISAGTEVAEINKKNFQQNNINILENDIKFSMELNGTYENKSQISALTSNYRFVECAVRFDGWVNAVLNKVEIDEIKPIAVSKAGQQKTSKACVLPLALNVDLTTIIPDVSLPTQTQKNVINSQNDAIWGGLKIVQHVDYAFPMNSLDHVREFILGFGFCNVSTTLDKQLSIMNYPAVDIKMMMNERYSRNASPSAYDSNRRLFSIPVINANSKITKWVCLEQVAVDLIRFRGSAVLVETGGKQLQLSPCIMSGIPGVRVIGPFAPVLIR